MNNLILQLEDSPGRWKNFASISNNPQRIVFAMDELKRQYPTKRVRVVDSNGRLIDMMI